MAQTLTRHDIVIRGVRILECAAVGALVIGGILATFDPANTAVYHNIGGAVGAFVGVAFGIYRW